MEEPCVHRASAMYPEHAKRGSTPIPEVFGSKVSSMGSVQDASLDAAGGSGNVTATPKLVHGQLLSDLSELEKLTGNMMHAGRGP